MHIVVLTDHLIMKVSSCPPGTQGATLDIVCMYRNSLLALRHKAYVASMWRDNIYIDHCAMEGFSSLGNIQGIPVDALVVIIKRHGVDNVLKWVGNFCFFCCPISSTPDGKGGFAHCYSIDIPSILSITDPLGIPWHTKVIKGQDFTSAITYVGFVWDLEKCMVSLLSKKGLKYLVKAQSFLSLAGSKVTHKDVMAIHGTLQHIYFVYRQGRPFLPPLSAFISKFPNDYACHHVPKSVIESLKWWEAILQNPSNSCSLLPCIVVDLDIWVDASTNWGIGVVFG